jgi:hypothetical protein
MSFESTTFHEAGHAVCALLYEHVLGTPQAITAIPYGRSAGSVVFKRDPLTDFTPRAVRAYGRTVMAGGVAAALAGFKSDGWSGDAKTLNSVAILAKRGSDFTKESIDCAEFLLRMHWGAVKEIAGHLGSLGALVGPSGIELARMALQRRPMRKLGLTGEMLLRLAPSIEKVPEICAPLKAELAAYAAPPSRDRPSAKGTKPASMRRPL